MTLLNSLQKTQNYARTNNGALGFSSTGSELVDMFARFGNTIPVVKNQNTISIIETNLGQDALDLFIRAYHNNPLYAIRLLFYFRDIRGGGKRKSPFIVCYRWLANNYPDIAVKLLDHIPFYGSYKDFAYLLDTKIGISVAQIWYHQVIEDYNYILHDVDEITLAGKHFPSENAGKFAQRSYQLIKSYVPEFNERSMRIMLSKIRAHLKIVERDMTNNNWSEINYEHVPSRAMQNYSKAFTRHDEIRFGQYNQKVEKGEAKINAGTLTPVEIMHQVISGQMKSNVGNNQWNNLPKVEMDANILVLGDSSGSMSNGGGKYQPIEVMTSLAIYFAEQLPKNSPFYGHFLTFSSSPTLHKIVGKTLEEKYNNLRRAKWDSSTQINKAFELILNSAVRDNLAQSAMPSVILVISDMQFDGCCKITNHATWKQKFTDAGYTLPFIVFWNVGHDKVMPVYQDQTGTMIISGFSESLLGNILQGDFYNLTPEGMMLQIVNKERYIRITL